MLRLQVASSSMIHSAPTSSSRSCKYDIFLSFRGADTRNTFIDHLYSSLEQHLIATYKDDVTLPRGESIRPSLFKAIEESYIALVIFSKNYADSSWCLDELTHIIKCKEERGLIVMPIFYDVEPTDVRNQIGDFGAAFAQQEAKNANKAQLWRNTLIEASNFAGWEPKNVANGHESEVIKKIVDTILERLPRFNTNVNEDLIGMTTRLQELKELVNIGSDGVRMVGIWGIGGSGKTTLATSFCMEVSEHFQCVCTIENVREETNKFGLKKLQEDILFSLFKTKVHVQSVREGREMIKERACRRKVLLVLDDVSTLDQLEALVGKHNWFGSGSRIVITTRDEHLLKTHKVDEVYEVRLLTEDEAIQLFDRHAYNRKAPIEDYKRMSLQVISYAARLPLALKVFGSFLYDKKKNEWISALERLKDTPEMEIVEKLKISYDGLKPMEKDIFLDLVCFFRGKSEHKVMNVLQACGYYPEIGIVVLRQKALITIKNGDIEMHDLIQEMGHYIVRGKHPNNLEKHSRVWRNEEIEKTCLSNATMENDTTEAIKYKRYGVHSELEQKQFCKFISNMKKLRYLHVNLVRLIDVILGKKGTVNVEGPNFLSNELRFFKWTGYGKSPFPDAFQPMNLVSLRLYDSMQKHLWKGCKHLPSLKELILENMPSLVSAPDFSELPRLQTLKIIYCDELKEIHPSLGNHTSLKHVYVWSCSKLKMFPAIVHMESLETLSLASIGIEVLPLSIEESCPNLNFLHLSSLDNLESLQLNLDTFQHLKSLTLYGLRCFKDIPYGISALSKLEKLILRGGGFSRLGFNFVQHNQLEYLNLSDCENLIELPELPSSLNVLVANKCKSLVTLGDCYKSCTKLCDVSFEGGGIISDGDRLLESMLQACMAIENRCMVLVLQGLEVAKRFTPCVREGDTCRLELPEDWCNVYAGFLICEVYENTVSDGWITMKEISMSDTDYEYDLFWKESDGGMTSEDDCRHVTYVKYVPFASLRDTKWWNPAYKTLQFHCDGRGCSGFGVRLVEMRSCGRDSNETSTNTSHYTPRLHFQKDDETALTILLFGPIG